MENIINLELKKIILGIEEVFDRLENAVEDKSKLTNLYENIKELARLRTIYLNLHNNQSLKFLFKWYDTLYSINKLLDKIEVNLDILFETTKFIMSSTYVGGLNDDCKAIARKINKLTFDYSFDETLYKPSDPIESYIDELIKINTNNTWDLFIQLVRPLRDIPIIRLKLEEYRYSNQNEEYLSHDLYTNLLHRCNMISIDKFVPLKSLFGVSSIEAYAKYKKIDIICITKYTSTIYNLDKLYSYVTSNGVNNDMIKLSHIIIQNKELVKSSIKLYKSSGDIVNVLAKRKFSPKFIIRITSNVLVIECVGKDLYRKIHNTDIVSINWLLNGTKPISTTISESIVAANKGVAEIKPSLEHVPVAHLRQKIISDCVELLTMKDKAQLDKFIYSEDIDHIFIQTLYKSFEEYNQKNTKEIIIQESMLSFLQDINLRFKRFRSELNTIYNDKYRKIIFVDNKINIKLFEEMMTTVIDYVIPERDSIYNLIEEKRMLLL